MHIDCVKNSGKPYLRIAESYSIKVNGIRKNRKRTIYNIGPLSRFDDGKPDFLLRLRQSFKNGNPIIECLNNFIGKDTVSRKILLEFDKDDQNVCFSTPKNIGYFILDSLYDSLGIYDVLNLQKSRKNIGYDLNGLTKLLTFGRILHPNSKYATRQEREHYLFDIVSSDSQIEIYRTLDVLNEKSETIQKRMNLKIIDKIGRNTDICFYDVTNYWFDIDNNDKDKLDEYGNIVEEGIRKFEPSKAQNHKPIVQMGLFIDDNGIPIAYKLFPGNHIDQTTLRPTLKKTIYKMNFNKVIIIADGGLNSGKNLANILKEGNGYIVSKSIRKSDKNTKEWILEEDGYEWNESKTFKIKSIIRERTINDENGEEVLIKEKLVSYRSKKYYDYELHQAKKFIKYLETVIANPSKLKINKKKIEKFIVTDIVDKNTGEILKATPILSLNIKKIKEYKGLMGYYTIMTSEIDKPNLEIIDKYHGLSRIEDSFRIIKSNLEGRPVYVRTEEHINAHFLICFIALTMIRIIQHKVLLNKKMNKSKHWESGITGEKIKEALGGFMADPLSKGYYRLTKPTEDLEMIMKTFGVS
ncbi:MAG: IS1634 family transposase, partial [Fusobacteriaceae bacterium]|nr:IS1634 family transposase [Fusobacteriaceae bacterium]